MNYRIYISAFLAIGVCFACSSSTSSYQDIDERVTSFERFKSYFEPDIWDKEKRTTSDDQKNIHRGCVPPSVIETKKRIALNLAGSRHFDEAIQEVSDALSMLKKEKLSSKNHKLAEFYLLRSNLYRAKQDKRKAIIDLQHAQELMKNFPTLSPIPIALYQMKLGQNEEAENTLTESIPAVKHSRDLEIAYYLLGTIQENQGKLSKAKNSYIKAARLFLDSGASEPANAAIDRVNSIEDSNAVNLIQKKDISPPKAEIEKVERILKTVTGASDLFDAKEVKRLTGINLKDFRNSGNFYESPFNPHRRLFERVNLKHLGTKKHLQICIDPTICSFLKKDAEPLIADLEKTEAPRRLRKGYADSEAFKVENGTLILSWMSGGFNALKQIDLYSGDVEFPYSNSEQWYHQQQQHQSLAQQSYRKVQLQSRKIDFLINENKLDAALEAISKWEAENPKEYAVHYKKFQVLNRKKDYQRALDSLKQANTCASSDYTREFLKPKFACVLISLEKYQSALDLLEKMNSRHLDADYYFLLGKAQFGLHRFSEAKKNLDLASEKYYNSGLIVKRDEVDALKKKLPVLF